MYAHNGQRQNVVQGAYKSALEYVLSKVISRHGKRIFFITSLYFQVVQIEKLKAEALSKLNAIMKLAHHEEALRLPAALRGRVWDSTALHATLSGELLDQDVTDERAKEISRKVVELTPHWLRYGHPDSGTTEMEKDIVQLIRSGKELAAVA